MRERNNQPTPYGRVLHSPLGRSRTDAKKIRLPMQETAFGVIRDQLESFKAVRLAKYQR